MKGEGRDMTKQGEKCSFCGPSLTALSSRIALVYEIDAFDLGIRVAESKSQRSSSFHNQLGLTVCYQNVGFLCAVCSMSGQCTWIDTCDQDVLCYASAY